jgi:hypothetical protein
MRLPAQRTLGACYAKQAADTAAAASVAGSFAQVLARIPADAFARAVGEVFPELPAASANGLNVEHAAARDPDGASLRAMRPAGRGVEESDDWMRWGQKRPFSRSAVAQDRTLVIRRKISHSWHISARIRHELGGTRPETDERCQ